MKYQAVYHDNFTKSVFVSVGLHIIVVFLFVTKAYFLPEKDMVFESAIRVDLVALPDKLPNKPEPPKQEPPPKQEVEPEIPPPPKPQMQEKEILNQETLAPKVNIKKPEIKKPDPIELLKMKDRQKDSFTKLKNQDSIDKLRAESEREKAKTEIHTKVAQFKGNVLSPGTALTGLNKLQHEDFQNLIDRHVKQFWLLPQWLASKNLAARLRVRIDANGVLISREILRSSGNADFDEIVLETVQKANPFPKPPDKFVSIYGYDGIILGFPE